MKKIIEKIFKRKELADLKKDVQEKERLITLATSGYVVHLAQHERRMILKAIQAPTFRELIEAPATKAYARTVYRSLREKIKLSIWKEDHETPKASQDQNEQFMDEGPSPQEEGDK